MPRNALAFASLLLLSACQGGAGLAPLDALELIPVALDGSLAGITTVDGILYALVVDDGATRLLQRESDDTFAPILELDDGIEYRLLPTAEGICVVSRETIEGPSTCLRDGLWTPFDGVWTDLPSLDDGALIVVPEEFRWTPGTEHAVVPAGRGDGYQLAAYRTDCLSGCSRITFFAAGDDLEPMSPFAELQGVGVFDVAITASTESEPETAWFAAVADEDSGARLWRVPTERILELQ